MIVYLGGPEGGGKTALMTRYNRIHYLMGGECWAFPGYELLNNRGRVVSRLVMPEEIMGLLDDMQYVVLSIDEIQNFLNHHHWADKLVEIMTEAAAQRRKRQFVILATGPEFEWVPKDLRQMFHEVIDCRDRHWKNHAIPRGQQIEFYRVDRRGVLSGRIGARTPSKTFWAGNYFRYFKTLSLVDPSYRFRKVRIKKEEVLIDSSGHIINNSEISDPASLDRYISNYRNIHEDPLMKVTKQVISKLLNSRINIKEVDSGLLYNAIGGGKRKTVIGRALVKLGAISNKEKKLYDLSGVSIPDRLIDISKP